MKSDYSCDNHVNTLSDSKYKFSMKTDYSYDNQREEYLTKPQRPVNTDFIWLDNSILPSLVRERKSNP